MHHTTENDNYNNTHSSSNIHLSCHQCQSQSNKNNQRAYHKATRGQSPTHRVKPPPAQPRKHTVPTAHRATATAPPTLHFASQPPLPTFGINTKNKIKTRGALDTAEAEVRLLLSKRNRPHTQTHDTRTPPHTTTRGTIHPYAHVTNVFSCKKRTRPHTQTHDKNTTTQHTARTTPQTTTRGNTLSLLTNDSSLVNQATPRYIPTPIHYTN